MEVRRLREDDDRTSFSCGDDDLDRFFRRFAGQNQFRSHIGTTYVAVDDDGAILGYATVAAGDLEIDGLPPAARKKLPRYPLPVLRLARLAVDQRAQGKGLGKLLLRYVFELAWRMSLELGCIGVVVDAKEAAVGFYQAYGFFELEVVEGQQQTRPQPRAMFLPLKEIEAARKGK
jgi:GNAT superfamily N-acetyltransferase